jgi:hypothetical protein
MCSPEMLYAQLLLEKLAAEEAQRAASVKEAAEFGPLRASAPNATFDVGLPLFESLRRAMRSVLLAGRYNTSSIRGNGHG